MSDVNLRNPLIIFLDEAIGFRKSLHHMHRWFETNEQSELEQLVIEIGREHFVDMWPILNAVKSDSQAGVMETLSVQLQRGIYMPYDWVENRTDNIKLTPLVNVAFYGKKDFNELVYSTWVLRDWIDENEKLVGFNPLSCVAMMQQYIIDAKTDFTNIFKLLEMLFGYKTLASCVLRGSIDLFGEVAGTYYPSYATHIKYLATALKNSPDLNWTDALSRNQIKSKMWLLEKISIFPEYNKKYKVGEEPVTTVIVGGWVGMIPFLANMFGVKLGNVINVDTDTSVHTAAGTLNAGLYTQFKNSGTDIREFDFKKYKNLVVIDTIVEHFEKHGEWVSSLPHGIHIVVQGNDMFDVPDHVNCHRYISEFIDQCGVNSIEWAGELLLYKCNRFMAIGKT
jgi:hypothetical protein